MPVNQKFDAKANKSRIASLRQNVVSNAPATSDAVETPVKKAPAKAKAMPTPTAASDTLVKSTSGAKAEATKKGVTAEQKNAADNALNAFNGAKAPATKGMTTTTVKTTAPTTDATAPAPVKSFTNPTKKKIATSTTGTDARRDTQEKYKALGKEQLQVDNISLDDLPDTVGTMSNNLQWITAYGDNHKKTDGDRAHFTVLGSVFKALVNMEVPQLDVSKTTKDGWSASDIKWVGVKAGQEFILSKEECFVLFSSDKYGYQFNMTCRTLAGKVEDGCACVINIRWAELFKNKDYKLPSLSFNAKDESGTTAKESMDGIYVSDDKDNTELKPRYKEKYANYGVARAKLKNPNAVEDEQAQKVKHNVVTVAAMRKVLNNLYATNVD